MTEEVLTSIYQRAMQYCKARFGNEPDRLEITEYGALNAVFDKTCWGQYAEESETISIESLSMDLEEAYRLRKEEEHTAYLKREAEKRETERKNAEYQQQKEISNLHSLMKKYPKEIEKIFGGLGNS